ncbi:unnamed protein product, partial [Mesorhabditis belari]|uniref:Secreted protein n=1 Tax=Mesorhabditis belari TaxID=2138241 RepID=A0AAF3FDN3_9BILA
MRHFLTVLLIVSLFCALTAGRSHVGHAHGPAHVGVHPHEVVNGVDASIEPEEHVDTDGDSSEEIDGSGLPAV